MEIISIKPINNQVEKVSNVINYQDKVWNKDLLKEIIIEDELGEIIIIFI